MAPIETPSDEIFNEIKRAALSIWNTYDNTYGYVDEKVGMINRIENYKDNWGTFVGMFDSTNQAKLWVLLSPEARDLVKEWM